MRQHHRKPMVDRMARIEGHVRAVKQMLEDDRDCPDVLIQLAAIRSAVDAVARLVLEDHLDACLINAVETGHVQAELDQIKAALRTFWN